MKKDAERAQLSREDLLRHMNQLRLESFIFNDDHPGDAGPELKELFGAEFLSDRFALILLGPVHRQNRARQYVGIPLHLLEKTLIPILSTYGNVAIFPVMDRTLCVVNPPLGLSDSPGGWTGAIASDLTACLNSLDNGGNVRCAIGALTSGPNIQQMYRTAEIVMDHTMNNGPLVTTWYSIPWKYLEHRAEQTITDDLALLERQFMNHVHARHFFEAVSVLDQITNIRIWKAQCSLRHIRSAVFFRLESVLSTCGVCINPQETSAEVYSSLEKVSCAQSFEQLRAHTYDVFALLDDLLNREEAKSKKAAHIRQFIDKVYADPNLDASMICDRFKLSEVYLSRVFKESYQISWLDYVHQVRLEKAKELLEHTDMKLEAIADAVGFTPRTMARQFKNSEGVPPGAYREAVRRVPK